MQTLLQDASERLIKICAVIVATVLVFLCSTISIAQNATKTAPNAYKLQLENKWVRVIRVHSEGLIVSSFWFVVSGFWDFSGSTSGRTTPIAASNQKLETTNQKPQPHTRH